MRVNTLGNRGIDHCFEGVLDLSIGDEQYTLNAGDSIRFKADRTHTYQQTGEQMVRMQMILYYPHEKS